MKQTKYNNEQVAKLLENKFIAKCSLKSISFTKEFKLFAVNQYINGKTAPKIFNEAGIDSQLVGRYVPDNCLRLWRKKFKAKGEVGLMIDERGLATGVNKGRPRTKGLTDTDKIKRLEIEVAYLKAKNYFLVKLRAKRKS